MDLWKARNLALDLMQHHGVLLQGWRFEWDRARRRFGCCNYTRRVISLSEPLTRAEVDESKVRNTILHEIAHVLAGSGHGHDRFWRATAVSIGCTGERTTSGRVEVQPTLRATCPTCGKSFNRFRRPRGGLWCKCSAHGFRPELALRWERVR